MKAAAERGDVDASGGHELEPLGRLPHWRRVRWLTATLMLAWSAASFVIVFNARAWSFNFCGWPFSFWWAAQGAPLVFLALVAIYAGTMNQLDRRHGVDEQE